MKKNLKKKAKAPLPFDFDEDKIMDRPDSPGLINFPHSIGSAVIKPEDLGKIKGRALSAMREQTKMQLGNIYEQMQLLAKQAKDIKGRVEVSEKIYLAQIQFEPVIGQVYHLYKKNDEDDVLSMISPREWGNKCPYKKHLATIKLLSDHTWEVMENNQNK
jgi:hypothetical protein